MWRCGLTILEIRRNVFFSTIYIKFQVAKIKMKNKSIMEKMRFSLSCLSETLQNGQCLGPEIFWMFPGHKSNIYILYTHDYLTIKFDYEHPYSSLQYYICIFEMMRYWWCNMCVCIVQCFDDDELIIPGIEIDQNTENQIFHVFFST